MVRAMILRRLGKIIRGKATPFQIIAACVLGSVLGFMPGFLQAPGLMLAVILLLSVLNANLALAALVGVGAKLLALLLSPVSFEVGRFLLDGPTSGLFRRLINAPVWAWMGFEYYLTTGGLLMGLVVGVILGWLLTWVITSFRRRMAVLEKDSERYQRLIRKRWVRFLTWLLVGGGAKRPYEQLLSRRIGNPIRPIGLAAVVLAAVVVWAGNQLFAEPIFTILLKSSLERANGATVDLEAAELDLGQNRLLIRGLAMADAKALDRDLFRAERLEADLSFEDFLRKRWRFDRIEVSGGASGQPRAEPGRLVGPPPEPEPDPDKPADAKTLDDYLRQAREWKERLAQFRRWLEKISGPEEGAQPPGTPPAAERKETLRERLEREIREKGYARVRADHLLEGRPTLTITELIARQVRVNGLEGETLDIEGRHLSTHPNLLPEKPEFHVRSSTGNLAADLVLGAYAQAGGTNRMALVWRGLPTDRIAGDLKIAQTQPLQGGTLDLRFDGSWVRRGRIEVNLPLEITLHGVQVALPSGQSTLVDNLTLPVSLSGPLDNPRVRVDDKGLTQALLAAGKARVVEEATKHAEKLLEEKVGGDLGEKGKSLLKGILGGDKKQP